MTPTLVYESHTPDVCPDLLEQFRCGSPETGSTLWKKRNWIWKYGSRDGSQWAVKRFADRWLSRIIYSVRSSKARRSYLYATDLLRGNPYAGTGVLCRVAWPCQFSCGIGICFCV